MFGSIFKNRENKNNLELNSKNIENLNYDNVKWFSLDGLNIKCKCIDVYDGDTITLIVPFLNTFFKKKCRLQGIDCAELRSKNEVEKNFAKDTKLYLENMILNKIVYIRCGKDDKYGRTLIKVYLNEHDLNIEENSINDSLIEIGRACVYDGKTKKIFEDWFNKDKV